MPRPSSGKRKRLWPEFKLLRKKVQPIDLRGLFRLRPSSEAFSMLASGAVPAWVMSPSGFTPVREQTAAAA